MFTTAARRAIRTARPVALASEFEDQAADETTIEVPEDLTALSREDLDALHAEVGEAFDTLFGTDEGRGLTTDQVEALSVLAANLERIEAEQGSRDTADAERAAEAQALASRLGRSGAASTEGEEPAEGGEEAPAEEPAEEEAVVASATRVTVPGLNARRNASRRRAPAPEPEQTVRDVLFAAENVPGIPAGQGVDFAELSPALDRRFATYDHARYKAAAASGRKMRQSYSLATIRKPIPAGTLITERTSDVEANDIIEAAKREASLPGGSLVASGGWCAPSETLYDLCELESRDGILSAPEVNTARGGFRYTTGPSFQDIYTATGFSYTEEEAIAGDWDGEGGGSKPCYQIECPPFEEERLNLDGVCITGGLLQARAYPELTARILRGALVAHDHKMNANYIGALVAGSTAITMPADQVGATAPILTSIELQVEHVRTVNRMARSATVEAVFPFWVRGVVRSDLSRRLGVDLLDVPDSRITAWFTQRGIAAQFVYDWQDIGTTAATGFTQWPTTVQFLMYPAGTWVKGSADVITLDNVYDSTLLGTNDYTALFSEEGWLALKTCQDSRVVTVNICPDGATHAGVDIDCDGSAAA